MGTMCDRVGIHELPILWPGMLAHRAQGSYKCSGAGFVQGQDRRDRPAICFCNCFGLAITDCRSCHGIGKEHYYTWSVQRARCACRSFIWCHASSAARGYELKRNGLSRPAPTKLSLDAMQDLNALERARAHARRASRCLAQFA